MSVGLVSDVPNDTVVGGVEDIMERHGQFHHTETRSEMPWIVGQLVDDVLAEFIADVGQRLNAQSTQSLGESMWLRYLKSFSFFIKQFLCSHPSSCRARWRRKEGERGAYFIGK